MARDWAARAASMAGRARPGLSSRCVARGPALGADENPQYGGDVNFVASCVAQVKYMFQLNNAPTA